MNKQILWCLRVQENNKIEWHELRLQEKQVGVLLLELGSLGIKFTS
jgi:hypothetical protein